MELWVLVAIVAVIIIFIVIGLRFRKNPDIKVDMTSEDDDVKVYDADTDGDEDIKIAGGQFTGDSVEEDSADKAAAEYLSQKEAGNIEVAGALGELLAGELWSLAQELIMKNEGGASDREIHQQILLCSYASSTLIMDSAPNHLLAETALSVYYSKIEELSSTLYKHVSDTASFSLYVLNKRASTPDEEVGRIYAKLSGAENNFPKIREGNEIYKVYYQRCEELVQKNITYNKLA